METAPVVSDREAKRLYLNKWREKNHERYNALQRKHALNYYNKNHDRVRQYQNKRNQFKKEFRRLANILIDDA